LLGEKVGAALGIHFDDDKEGLYEEIEALVSVTLDHLVALYKAPDSSRRSYASKYVVEVRPWSNPKVDFGWADYQLVEIDISTHIAALVSHRTGLNFVVPAAPTQ
jgi:hypothetical protein